MYLQERVWIKFGDFLDLFWKNKNESSIEYDFVRF